MCCAPRNASLASGRGQRRPLGTSILRQSGQALPSPSSNHYESTTLIFTPHHARRHSSREKSRTMSWRGGGRLPVTACTSASVGSSWFAPTVAIRREEPRVLDMVKASDWFHHARTLPLHAADNRGVLLAGLPRFAHPARHPPPVSARAATRVPTPPVYPARPQVITLMLSG